MNCFHCSYCFADVEHKNFSDFDFCFRTMKLIKMFDVHVSGFLDLGTLNYCGIAEATLVVPANPPPSRRCSKVFIKICVRTTLHAVGPCFLDGFMHRVILADLDFVSTANARVILIDSVCLCPEEWLLPLYGVLRRLDLRGPSGALGGPFGSLGVPSCSLWSC